MRPPPLALFVALATLALSPACSMGNVPSNALPMVRGRASSDLKCADKDIRVEEQLGGRYKAVGCGRKAYYQAACEGLRCVVHGDGETMVPWRDRPDPVAADRGQDWVR